MTLTFDLLTSKCVLLCPELHLSCEFGEIPANSLQDIVFTNF